MRKNRIGGRVYWLFAALVILIISYVGAYDEGQEVRETLDLTTQVYTLITKHAAEPTEPQELIFDGIRGMLRTLDPHTHFLDSKTYNYMREEQEGSFFGIGISFDIREGVLTVISPIEGTPAYEAGIMAGDRIVAIEGVSTTGITTSEVINKLRGKQGTPVTITIDRMGMAETFDVTLIRDRIPLKSVQYPIMLDSKTGYVRVINFASSTRDELLEVLNQLKKRGMEQFILDLRNNSGGLLAAANKVSALFLQPGQMIVSTRGRIRGSNMKFTVPDDEDTWDVPLIVLVNEWSASASEIVAGAVQDHDRGLILGAETFGKGLVGSLYSLKNDCALQVTTAQYYTPSGRFIQKPYDIPHRKQAQTGAQGAKEETQETFYTESGREVYSEGGINPDVYIEDELVSDLEIQLNRLHYFNFAISYVSDHEVTKELEITDEILEEFRRFLIDNEAEFHKESFLTLKDKIKNGLKARILSVALEDPQIGYEVTLKEQPHIKKAMELFPRINEMIAEKDRVADRSDGE